MPRAKLATDAMATLVGRLNTYTCPAPHVTVTVDRDDGTTPFMISCPQVTDERPCGREAFSAFYNVSDPGATLEPTHEWYRPSAEEASELTPAVRQHVEDGGLLMRPVGTARKIEPPVHPDSLEAPRGLSKMAELVWRQVRAAGSAGLTSMEVDQRIRLRQGCGLLGASTVSARLVELEARGLVRDTGRRRLPEGAQRRLTVWVGEQP